MTVRYGIAALTFVLGAGSLSLFGVFLWRGGFGVVRMPLDDPARLAWDAGLCLLFFLQHSGMVRRSFRAWLGRAIPEHWLGIVYTIASAVALTLLVVLWQVSPEALYLAQGPARWLARAVLLGSLAGVLWGMRSLDRFDAFGIEALLAGPNGTARPTAKLAIRGPYRFVRHPFYAFCIVALWATPALTLDRLVLNVLFTAWTVLGAMLEERDLAAAFGEPYRLYQRAVPMLVPGMIAGRLKPR